MRRVYNPLGFSKGYNFILCKLTADVAGPIVVQPLTRDQQGFSRLAIFSASHFLAWRISPTTAFSAAQSVMVPLAHLRESATTGCKIHSRLVSLDHVRHM